ncbi:MAG: nuclear transport factor 2 family protein [Akkermansiaceae bacterium]|nr:nuclear transport factor 2 family protein [Armatimonadota bacterium]
MSNEQKVTTETGALSHPHVQLVKRYQAAMATGDFATGATFFAPDVRYVVPGDNPLSGDFVGAEQVMGYFGKLMEVTGGTYRITEMLWLVCENEVALVTTDYAERKGQPLIWSETIVFEIIDGKKKFIRLFQSDQETVDAFFR